jgi:ectoine hydroxylase-related dioxygenase (phytanoyl-CoA dioxygenase family)
MKNSGAYDLKRFYASHQLLDNCTMMTGKRGDVVAFDGRLLHQSVKNITSNFRNVISFSLFDGKRHPSYKNAK